LFYIENDKYLSLWELDLSTKIWENILTENENENENEKDPYRIKLKTRAGHSMLFDPINENLIIMGGNKISKKKNDSTFHLFDIILYNTRTKTLRELSHDYSREKGPNVNFALNSFYNYKSKEIIFFGGGFILDKQDIVSNIFWIFKLETKKWEQIKISENFINYDYMLQEDLTHFYGNANTNNKFFFYNKKNIYNTNKSFCNFQKEKENESKDFFVKNKFNSNLTKNVSKLNFYDSQLNEPLPRFAHTMVFSIKLNKGFIFGGNPNIKIGHSNRFNDFWSFTYFKNSPKDIKNIIKSKILKLYLYEKSLDGDMKKVIEIFKKIKKLEKKNLDDYTELLRNFIVKPDVFLNKEKDQNELYKMRFDLFHDIKKYFNDFINE
jgi:hypothetical protein